MGGRTEEYARLRGHHKMAISMAYAVVPPPTLPCILPAPLRWIRRSFAHPAIQKFLVTMLGAGWRGGFSSPRLH